MLQVPNEPRTSDSLNFPTITIIVKKIILNFESINLQKPFLESTAGTGNTDPLFYN